MKRTGELLKKAREKKRLSLHEVALFLKINSRVLQAIEDGDQSQLPAKTFLRGFIQSYAKFLKLDSQEVLQIFADETFIGNPVANPIAESTSKATTEISPAPEASKSSNIKLSSEEKNEADNASLEKSILTKSQVAQDKLSIKTIAVSVLGLLLVIVLYFTNSLVKKYQKEAQVEPVEAISSHNKVISQPSLVEANREPISSSAQEENQNSVQRPTQQVINPLISIAPVTLPNPKVDQKEKLSDTSQVKLVEKTIAQKQEVPPKPTLTTTRPVENPVTKPIATPTAATAIADTQEKKEISTTPEGKLVEVIVEANDAVEIEYSSLKTAPQKMVLKPEQIHTFKSRSGVRLKISNGGAVNIIMNGRDLGVPGAAGQPVQVTY